MTKNYVCRTPNLRKHTSYDRDFWYTKIKWWHFQIPFLFFFKILISRERGQSAKNGPKWQKIMCVSLCISETIPHLILVFWYACVKWWCLKQFFSFFQNSDILDFALWFRKGKRSDRGGSLRWSGDHTLMYSGVPCLGHPITWGE